MRRTVLLRLIALAVAVAAIAAVALVAYNFGTSHAVAMPYMRGAPVRGFVDGMSYYWPGFGLFGLLGFVVIGLLFFWLLAALLSPGGGGRMPVGPATGDMERLRELSEMHDRSQLTDEEFSAAKRKLLGLS